MRQYWLSALAALALVGCGDGSPFGGATTTTDGTTTTTTIPDTVTGSLTSYTFDATTQTLVVRGISLDDTPFEATYRRRPAMDRNGYLAFTAQDGSLNRHVTAYVLEIDGTSATVLGSGPHLGEVVQGSRMARASYDPPDAGLVKYAGHYIGLLNGAGDGGDLLAVAAGTAVDIRPTEAAEVTGDAFVTADFVDNKVSGLIYNRVFVDSPGTALENLELRETAIDGSGTFSGNVHQGSTDKGDYAGVFGGTDSSAVAGALHATDHIAATQNEKETGIFVLGKCGTPTASAVCTQPVP